MRKRNRVRKRNLQNLEDDHPTLGHKKGRRNANATEWRTGKWRKTNRNTKAGSKGMREGGEKVQRTLPTERIVKISSRQTKGGKG